jgi:hypothetical protein
VIQEYNQSSPETRRSIRTLKFLPFGKQKVPKPRTESESKTSLSTDDSKRTDPDGDNDSLVGEYEEVSWDPCGDNAGHCWTLPDFKP